MITTFIKPVHILSGYIYYSSLSRSSVKTESTKTSPRADAAFLLSWLSITMAAHYKYNNTKGINEDFIELLCSGSARTLMHTHGDLKPILLSLSVHRTTELIALIGFSFL